MDREIRGEQLPQARAPEHKAPLIREESKAPGSPAFPLGQDLRGFGDFHWRRKQGNAPDMDFSRGEGRDFGNI